VFQVCAIEATVHVLLLPQLRALEAAGYEVECVSSPGSWGPRVWADGLVIHRVPILRRVAPWADLKALVRLVGLLRRGRADVVHTHTPKAALLGQVAARLAGVPVRFNTVHGLYFYSVHHPLKRWLFKQIEVAACRSCTHVFSQSREDADFLAGEGHIPAARVEYIGNGINLSNFDPGAYGPEVRRAVRRELAIPQGAFVVGFVGRLVREKGLLELLEAFACLRREAPEAYLLVVGPMDRSRGLEVEPHHADRLGVGPGCRFLGFRDDMPRLYAAMDVSCLPSHREGYPRTVMEACAMGLPCVVTDIRGSREAVVDGVNGLRVPVQDAPALAAALGRLHRDAALRRRLGEHARRRAVEAFDEQRYIRTVVDRYRRIVPPPGAADQALAGAP
jgi:glycosyltransferase involved in cell wall biosynthesis